MLDIYPAHSDEYPAQGSNAPVVVFADADPEKAADTIAAFKYRNAGQVCISPTRFYVQEDVYPRFLKRFTEYANSVKVGDGLEKGMTMGPMANARRIETMEGFVNDAKSRGGKIETGGKRRGNQGYFFEPTVITEVPDDSKIMTQEPFGPLAPIVTFKTFDEVVERANSLEYGLAAYAFTSSNATAAAIGDAALRAGVAINVSAPQFFERDFVEHVARTLEATGLPASALELEITETVFQTGPATIESLRWLRALGVGLPYAIAVSLFGGTAPLIGLWFKDQGHESWFFWYITLVIFGSLLVYGLMRDTRDHSRIGR